MLTVKIAKGNSTKNLLKLRRAERTSVPLNAQLRVGKMVRQSDVLLAIKKHINRGRT